MDASKSRTLGWECNYVCVRIELVVSSVEARALKRVYMNQPALSIGNHPFQTKFQLIVTMAIPIYRSLPFSVVFVLILPIFAVRRTMLTSCSS
jgi:hypothetical protein